MKIEAACGCHRGRLRSNNEDNFFFNGQVLPKVNGGSGEVLKARQESEIPFCAGVFDGMGGEFNGEEAAWLGASVLGDVLRQGGEDPEKMLTEACLTANERICASAEEKDGGRMGATAAILYAHRENVWLCNIGDSRIYRLRAGELVQLSLDHNDAGLLRRMGITNRKPRLTQHLGIWPDELEIEPYIIREDARTEDRYLICSDGITDMIPDEEIGSILMTGVAADACVEHLIHTALEAGGRDNITAIVCILI